MSVHYKFKSSLEYDTVTFDGLHISVKDLKNSIIQQKRIGKNTDFDLQVTNAQTKEIYDDEQALIPKNTSLLIARIPLAAQNKSKTWEGYGTDQTPVAKVDEGGPASKAVDLANLDASEDDKIRAMMSQSTQDYDPSNYMKIRGANQVGAVPPNYKCYKCHQGGHWIKDCPLGQGTEQIEIKKSTGIPRSFMVPVEGPQVPGAMMTPYGSYAVPVLDHQTYSQKPAPPVNNPPPVQKTDIPEDLVCTICKDLLTDAVMIPCCGNSFCDECIRSSLLESEDHECPDCHDRDISPGTLIPNRFLRNSVLNFKNTTGYVKKPVFKLETPIQKEKIIITLDKDKKVEIKEADTHSLDKPAELEKEEKTIISEADSTEACKTTPLGSETKESPDVREPEKESTPVSDLPPGVSPKHESTPPKSQPIKAVGSVSSHQRERTHQSSRVLEKNNKPRSPRRSHKHHRSPQRYQENRSSLEDRPGTPTVDEPGMGGLNNGDRVYQPTNAPYPSAPPAMSIPTNLGPNNHLQGPPPNLNPPQNQFPPQMQFAPNPNMVHNGPPPNFRLPPPGPNPTNFMHGMYNAPPRPIFEPARPPLQGPPPNYQGFPSRHRGRDFGRGIRGVRTPPRIIDDPLEEFNRMLREKDERERRAKQRKGRSFSRSSSRSYSRSPRRRSRSPRRRSRSRSKSFTVSRSRSRSFSPLNRASPYRDYSPRRRVAARYKSPQRSPSRYRYKDGGDRARDREFDRDYERDRDRERDRDYGYNKRGYNRDKQTDYHYYDNYERDREKGMSRGSNKWGGTREGYYPQEAPAMYQQSSGPPPMQQVPNRYPREQYPVYKQTHLLPPLMPQQIMPMHRYDDVAPPGTEQPLPPGEEPPPPSRYDDRHPYDQRSPDLKPMEHQRDDPNEHYTEERNKNDYIDNNIEQKRHPRSSLSPSRSKDRNSSPVHKSKRYEGTPERKPDKERRRDHSDDDKSKKSKEKKKKRDKKETEKKVKKDKKEKREHKKDRKERSKTDKDKREDAPRATPKPVIEEKELKPIIKENEIEKKELEKLEEKKSECLKTSNLLKLEESPKKIDSGLYEDVLTEGIDASVTQSYGRIEEIKTDFTPEKVKSFEEEIKGEEPTPPVKKVEEDPKEYEDVLEIFTGDLKSELDKEMLAPLPEKSKWEIDDDSGTLSLENQQEIKNEKSNKVTNEVLKRAENAIFAKAINAIRPIEIKKISLDRAKFYSGEKDDKILEIKAEPSLVLNLDISEQKKHEAEPSKPVRLSVKERLGCKVDDLDRIVRVDKVYDRNRSRSLSPLAKRHQEIKNERRVEIDDKRRDRDRNHDRDRNQRSYRSGYDRRDRDDPRRHESHRDRRGNRERNHNDDPRSRSKRDEKRKRTRSKSDDKKDRHRKRDKKQKKEKPKKTRKENEEEVIIPLEKKKPVEENNKIIEKKKLLVDEENFIPDYDMETESEEEKIKPSNKGIELELTKKAKFEEKTESSSSDSSSTSSEDERKKKKHKKHKKRKRKESSSSSSDSDSSSSEDEKDRKKKKHKKKHKKKKKSKHK